MGRLPGTSPDRPRLGARGDRARRVSAVTLQHRAERIVDQRPDVVHDRLLELAARLRDELPPIEAGTQAATALGLSGPLAIEIADRGPRRIEIRTIEGRLRGEGAADLSPAAGDRTKVAVSVE